MRHWSGWKINHRMKKTLFYF